VRGHARLAPSAFEIAPLAVTERGAAVDLLARAFQDNPLNLAAIASARARRRRRSNAHGMRMLLPVAATHGLVLAAHAGGVLAGVLVAAPPNAYPFPAPRLGARLWGVLGQGVRVAARWREVFDALDAHHPREPHWYLGTLGVAPEAQRRGVGTVLAARWLDIVDAAGLPAWLETDRSENVGFYAGLGFAVVDELDVIGVHVFRLRRARRGEIG